MSTIEKKTSQDLASLIMDEFSTFRTPVLNGFIAFLIIHKKLSGVKIHRHMCQYGYIESHTLYGYVRKFDQRFRELRRSIDRNWLKLVEFLHMPFPVQPEDCINIQKRDELKELQKQELKNALLHSSSLTTDSPIPSTESAENKANGGEEITPIAAYNLRGGEDLTPRETLLQNRLSHVSLLRRQEAKKYKEIIKGYRNKIKSLPPTVKSAQKTFKRKNERITCLREKLKAALLGASRGQCANCTMMTMLFTKERNKCQQMKEKTELIDVLVTQNAERDSVIQKLQQDSLVVKAKVDVMESLFSPVKSEREIDFTEVAGMIQDCIENEVPIASIPSLIISLTSRMGVKVDLGPRQHSVEQMVKDVLVQDVKIEETIESEDILVKNIKTEDYILVDDIKTEESLENDGIFVKFEKDI
ncbi:uncharacterized protein LOC106068493 isoform X1 [Biomphalaria glabrata]|uniref:Uncharacterized protein LOC106068493 isoform X1 n=1 Tax=Biomphalaria glabrata TaxID=6526 RepID=A0A2C9LFR9_BIOGL|nr:uncharacterized protein LOC106068493 isoform X1 [Biomphalaria glabrata]XP_013083314.1 uncharacterized protein LOC106068493 isoform X1 [Biomphalaria glabrata]